MVREVRGSGFVEASYRRVPFIPHSRSQEWIFSSQGTVRQANHQQSYAVLCHTVSRPVPIRLSIRRVNATCTRGCGRSCVGQPSQLHFLHNRVWERAAGQSSHEGPPHSPGLCHCAYPINTKGAYFSCEGVFCKENSKDCTQCRATPRVSPSQPLHTLPLLASLDALLAGVWHHQ